MIFRLRVEAAETISAGDHRERRPDVPPGVAWKHSRTQHQQERHRDVVQVIDNVVEERAVENRDAFAHTHPSGQRPVGGIDDNRDGHPDEGAAEVIFGDPIQCEEPATAPDAVNRWTPHAAIVR